MSELDVAVGADARWVPLPTGADQDLDAWAGATAVETFALRHVTDPPADAVEQVTATLAGLARRIRRQDTEGEPGALIGAGAWVFAPEEQFHPLAVATLRVQAIDPSSTADDAVALLVDPDAERHGPVEVHDLVTPSGPAVRVTWRPVLREADDVRVEEQQAVLWSWPRHGLLLALSVWWTDLVAAGRWSDALDDLAGLVQATVVE